MPLMNTGKSHICTGILAHVDAGKTTLAEALLYTAGNIRRAGRVDKGDTFLDTHELERKRGITIFSKQAELTLPDRQITLMDTPGHVDFSAEMERTLQVLDYAVLVISGADGIQGHTQTLWRLLSRYEIPVFLFVNKMDQPETSHDKLIAELKSRLDSRCVSFSQKKDKMEEDLATCDDEWLEQYFETGAIDEERIPELIRQRRVFPCFFGSALKQEGIEPLLDALDQLTLEPEYPDAFAARVFKISRDVKGNRLTHLKVTGGCLAVKDLLKGTGEDGEVWEEKVEQIRLYSGDSFRPEGQAEAGTICAVTGLDHTYAGEGLGAEKAPKLPYLVPVLNYELKLPEGTDVYQMFLRLRQLEEEEPSLHLVWMESLGEIHAQVMGEIQIEILKTLIEKRFGMSVTFGTGHIVYKETIEAPVLGCGHFEPLRHYAEVHLLLEPGERGSGMVYESDCREDQLDKNWQRLILTHLKERHHKGVLTGSEITDMKITLIAGKAHNKHTEGGDFRQATYRAVRQGLMMAKSRILEPVYHYSLEIPSDQVGRAMTDIQKRFGTIETHEVLGERTLLEGKVPAAELQGYQTEVMAYTRGYGSLACEFCGYELCHNEEDVIEAAAYDPERDTKNPSASVFCAQGSGVFIDWQEAPSRMHVEPGWKLKDGGSRAVKLMPHMPEVQQRRYANEAERAEALDKELEEIFRRTYGEKALRKGAARPKEVDYDDPYWYEKLNLPEDERKKYEEEQKQRELRNQEIEAKHRGMAERKVQQREKYLLVDGYNIVFAWDELKDLAARNLDSARDKLMDIMSNYQSFRGGTLILVFDAYKVKGGKGSIEKYHNIYVVYTREAETADQYIEKTVHALAGEQEVAVATSDGLEQVIILGQGARRISARDFHQEVKRTVHEIGSTLEEKKESGKVRIGDLHDLSGFAGEE